MKLIIKLLFIMSLLITLNSCRTYKIYLKDGVNEAKVKKVAVPRKLRASGFHEEEDLTSLCPDSEIVYIRFFSNVPIEVWCDAKEANTN